METVSVFQRKWEANLREDVLNEIFGEPKVDEDPYSSPIPISLQEGCVIKEGWMYKRGDINQTWKLRYFRAEVTSNGESQIQYSAKPDDATPLGYISCLGYHTLAFDPKDNAEVLRQSANGNSVLPAPGESSLSYGIKLVPTNPNNVDGRLWWLKVDSPKEQVEWVEALRLLGRLFSSSAATQMATEEKSTSVLQTVRRSSMSLFRPSASLASGEDAKALRMSYSRASVLPPRVSSDKEVRRLRRVFAATFVQTRQYFSIPAHMLPCLRYSIDAEVQLLEETMEPVLRKHIFDRMADATGEALQLRGVPRVPRNVGLVEEITWCTARSLPPLPQYLPSRPHPLTDVQYRAAESVIRPAALSLWSKLTTSSHDQVQAFQSEAHPGELRARRDAILRALELNAPEVKHVAIACAMGGEEGTKYAAEGDGQPPTAMHDIKAFLLAMAPTNSLLLDSAFDALSQACLTAVASIHRMLEAGIGTPAAPGDLTTALLADVESSAVVAPPSTPQRRSSISAALNPSLSSASPPVSRTQAWLQRLTKRIITVVQPEPAAAEAASSASLNSADHSVLWEAQRALWEFYVTTMVSSEPVPVVLEANFLLGAAHAFDLLYASNMERVRITGATCVHHFQARVAGEMVKLRSEGMLNAKPAGGGGTGGGNGCYLDMSRRRIACKVLDAARASVAVVLVRDFEALLRSQLVKLLASQAEHELLRILVPALRKYASDADAAENAQNLATFSNPAGVTVPHAINKKAIWAPEPVGEVAGRRVVQDALAGLVDARMRQGKVSVMDRFIALSKRISLDQMHTAVQEATSLASTNSGLPMLSNDLVSCDDDGFHGLGEGRDFEDGSSDNSGGGGGDDDQQLCDCDFTYARESQLEHLEAAQKLRLEQPTAPAQP
jgi:hypothetical protein